MQNKPEYSERERATSEQRMREHWKEMKLQMEDPRAFIRSITPAEAESNLLLEYNGTSWIARETLHREGPLEGQCHLEVYDPMSFDPAEFQIYLLTDSLEDENYLKARQLFLEEVVADIRNIYKEDT